MAEIFTRLFDTSGFPPRWRCGDWSDALGWLHIVSDLGVWSAYVAIPCVLGYFVTRRKDVPFRGILWLFGAFILACGSTHLMEAAIFWWPAYRLAGVVKLFTAIVSWATVLALIPVMPKALAMRTPEELEQRVVERTADLQRANAALRIEMQERRRAEHDLQESEEKFRTLADSIPQLAWMARSDGTIVWYNRRWYDYSGTSPEQVLGWGWQMLHDPEHLPRVLDGFRAALAAGEPWEDTFPLRRHDGAMRWHLSRALPIRDDHGRIIRWFGTNTDITERMEMEEALKLANREKDDFLAMLAHELRNPLAPIRNALEVIRRTSPPSEAPAQALEMAARQVAHMARLLDDLLDVSRISRNRIELRIEPVDLVALVNRSIEAVAPMMSDRGHEVDFMMPAGPITVEGDPTRLEQVVVNLLNNAAKYTEPGGRIRAELWRGDGEVALRIRDNGIGIAPEMLTRIFEPFVQAARRLEQSQGGVGIGLTLVQKLVELHGGTVEAYSEGLGRGSEFVVRLPTPITPDLPANGVSHPPALEPARLNHASTRHRVLVVDDNVDAAVSLGMLLKLAGQEVRVAYDGPAALRQATDFRPHLVLLDIGMPGMDGYEVCRRLRRESVLERTTVVALTGWGQDEDRRRSHEAGFDHHIVKPVEPSALQRLLDDLPADSVPPEPTSSGSGEHSSPAGAG